MRNARPPRNARLLTIMATTGLVLVSLRATASEQDPAARNRPTAPRFATHSTAIRLAPVSNATLAQLIVDGGFENGGIPSSNWDPETSTNFGTPLCDNASCGTGGGTAPPRTGLIWAWFGGAGALETATLGQTVTIPTNVTADLTFWLRIGSVSSPFTDVLNVRVDGALVQAFPEPAVAEGAYTLRTINMNAFANGAAHAILFEYIGPTTGVGNFTVDDVELNTTPIAVATVAPVSLAVDAAGNGVLQPNETAVVVAPTWRNTGSVAIASLTGTQQLHRPGGTDLHHHRHHRQLRRDRRGRLGQLRQRLLRRNGHRRHPSGRPTGTPRFWRRCPPAPPPRPGRCTSATASPTCRRPTAFYRFIETHPAQGRHRRLHGHHLLPGQLHDPRADGRLRARVQGGAGLQPARLRARPMFTDVPATSPFCRFIEELARRGVVTGCGAGNLYCPTSPVTREQMAVFVLRTLDPTLNPPACGTPNVFTDVPATSPFCRWIEELVRRGVVTRLRRRQLLPDRPRHPRADGRLPQRDVRPHAVRHLAPEPASGAAFGSPRSLGAD